MTVTHAYIANDTLALPASAREAIVATDGELLMRFIHNQDHLAFAQIVERHGGLVWIICREVLGHHQDVEDAFQATFIILAQRAKNIRSSDSAAAWLYKVAQRTSLAARRRRSRRREEELAVDPAEDEDLLALIHDRQMIHLLMEELRELPERYQVPLILRYFEGLSRRTIADQTDSTIAQIQGRLVRGRRMLRSRMLRRSVSLSLAAGAVANVAAEAGATLTPQIAVATAKSCLALKITGATGGATASALALAKQGVKAMWLASIMKAAAAVSTAFVVAGIAWAVEASGNGKGAGEKGKGAAVIVSTKSEDKSERNAQSPATGTITLDGNNGSSLTVNKGTLALTNMFVGGREAAEQALAERKALIEQRYVEQRKRIDALSTEKTNLLTQMEVRQLEQSHMQREIEQLHKMLIDLEFSVINKELDEKAQKEMAEQMSRIKDRLSQCTNRLVDETGRVAKRTVQLEHLQQEIARSERRLDDLDRQEAQLESHPTMGATENVYAPQVLPHLTLPLPPPATSATTNPADTFVAADLNMQQFQQVMAQQLEQLHLTIQKLETELTELRGQRAPQAPFKAQNQIAPGTGARAILTDSGVAELANQLESLKKIAQPSDASDELMKLQAENEKLKQELQRVKAERDKALKDLSNQ